MKEETKEEGFSSSNEEPISNFLAKINKILKFKQKYLLWVLILIAIGASGVSIYFNNRYHQAIQDPQTTAKAEADKLIAQISKIILLPSEETPTIATVSDPDKLKNQPFFNDTQKGDKVLIYTNARKAFIYRPGSNKIINIAPLTIGNPTPTPIPTLTPTPFR